MNSTNCDLSKCGYAVQRWVGSALDVIQSSYPCGLPEKAVAVIVQQLLSAISYVHSQGLIHRSIRASHVLLNSSGVVRLSGFRYAIHLCEKPATTHFDYHLESSLLWLAPEVLAQDLSGYDLKSDIYSLGVTLCEMANGFPPFSDMERLEMLYEKGRGTTPRLLDQTTMPCTESSPHSQRSFSEAFHNITELCLRSHPVNRPDAKELISHPFLRRQKKTLTDLIPLAKSLEEVERVSEKPTPSNEINSTVPEWVY
uniref:Protein kinase domain-containing protein n=1 Tax=Heterorhabditis bacteriophora TaxID=37862 RepID=A0A1I7XQ54_HETBA